MFGNKKENGSTKGRGSDSAPSAGGVNTIDAHTQIKGDITAKGNIRIDGTLVGDLDCGGMLVIGPKGSIEGNVSCVNASIEGKFEGNLLVKEELKLESNASVTGDVKAQKMAVINGAEVNGTCTVPYTGSSNGSATSKKKDKALANA